MLFAAEAVVAKSEPPSAEEFGAKVCKAEVFVVTAEELESEEFVVTAETLESEELVVTAVVVVAELVATSRPAVAGVNVLVFRASSPVVVDSNSVVFVLGEVEERLAAPVEELEG